MSFVDARLARDLTSLSTDVCIVGAGAAGITLASMLARARREVCLIESGGFAPDEQTQSLYDLESSGYAFRANYMSRVRYYGGSCNLWAGRSMPLNELDFHARAWVPDSGWPIAYDEIARWYPEATRILRLPALDGIANGSFLSRLATDERQLLEGDTLVPTFSLWARSAMRFGAAYRSELRRSRNLTLLLHASVTRVNLNDAGTAVDSLTVSMLAGGGFSVTAHVFVLACGGLENARLLLASRDRHPLGIGNAHDVVGRYFMDHPRCAFGRVRFKPSAKLYLLRGRPLPDGKLQVGIGPSPRTQEREGLLNHYVTFEAQTSGYTEARYQSFIQSMQVLLRRGHAGSRWDFARAHLRQIPDLIYLLSPKELMPHWMYRAYVALRDSIPRRPAPQTYVAVYFCEQPPDPESRVTLSSSADRLGMNRLNLHWRIDDSVVRSVYRLQELLRRRLEQTGMGRLEAAEREPAFTDASHHMGTTRMSDSPRKGVVDTDCRVHGIRNLFMAGSSVFPCAGHANPTLTIVALSLRLAEHLRTQAV